MNLLVSEIYFLKSTYIVSVRFEFLLLVLLLFLLLV